MEGLAGSLIIKHSNRYSKCKEIDKKAQQFNNIPYLWVLEASGQLLPEHPTGDEVGGTVRRLWAVHDAERDLRAADGGLERGHRLRVRQAAEADVVHREQEVALLRGEKWLTQVMDPLQICEQCLKSELIRLGKSE